MAVATKSMYGPKTHHSSTLGSVSERFLNEMIKGVAQDRETLQEELTNRTGSDSVSYR